jgi:hypothetical protein
MNPELQVKDALRALADQDRALEARTSAAEIFARRQPVANWRRRVTIAAVGLAAAAALGVSLWRSPEPHREPLPVVVNVPKPVEPRVPVAAVAAVAVAPKPVRRARRVTPPVEEVVTEFYPLMDAPPPFERGQLLRVVVPASTMRSVGLPVRPERWADRVQADVLVGEEGMARAIRFVSYER